VNPSNNKNNKFLFDLNKFDEEETIEEEIVQEEIYVEPPAPTFTEDDLEAAKAVAHAQGKSEGVREERAKREQLLADNLKLISEKLEHLFAEELYREKQYEEESLRLALEIIAQLSPSLIERFGKEELKKLLKDVMETQSEQTEIRIEVHPDYAGDIDQFIENLWYQNDNAPRCKVVANTEIELGGCALSWKDGGMVREPSKMVHQIKSSIEDLLVNTILAPRKQPTTQTKPAETPKKLQKNDGYKAEKQVENVTQAQNNGIKELYEQDSPVNKGETIEDGDKE